MPTSAARVEANRRNAQHSTGPKSAEGKAQSRRNGLKHGLTGQGIVVADIDQAEVDRRQTMLQEEMAPQSLMGAILVQQMATLSVRMERGAQQEFAAVATRVRNAADDFDEARHDVAEALLLGLGENPRTNRRKLMKSPEGVDLLIVTWQDLRADLAREGKPLWTAAHLVQATNLIGRREEEARYTEMGMLSREVWGDFGNALDDDDSDHDVQKAQARARLIERIDAEIADLEEHYETLDFEIIDQDRAEAGQRALFDPSKDAALARRYESEARRGFFKALAEFRKVEAAAKPVAAKPPVPKLSVPMASSCEPRPTAPDRSETPVVRPIPEPHQSASTTATAEIKTMPAPEPRLQA